MPFPQPQSWVDEQFRLIVRANPDTFSCFKAPTAKATIAKWVKGSAVFLGLTLITLIILGAAVAAGYWLGWNHPDLFRGR